MSAWFGAGFLVVGLVVVLRQFALAQVAQEVVGVTRGSLALFRDGSVSDEEKERRLQARAIRLTKLFLQLSGVGALAFLAPVGVLWLLERQGWLSLRGVFEVALSPGFLVGATAVAGLGLLQRPRAGAGPEDYGRADRVLHRVAFHSTAAQVALADMEDRLFAAELDGISSIRPVFITALPRAGTTLLLELCARSPQFASHCYRDMPFVLTPMLWKRFSERFRRDGEQRERAHGDGMTIDFDSPEALEEVVWKAFWKRAYQPDRIVPWTNAEDELFSEFFESHMKKIVRLRRSARARDVRYVSKNNLNIARTSLLRKMFSGCTILVPFRDPLQHASSLLRQHENFLELHAKDSFSKTYMKAIGHYEFGANLRPIDFDGWLETRETRSPREIGFWLEYWTAAYAFLLRQHESRLVFASYDSLCSNHDRGLRAIAGAIGCERTEDLLSGAELLRPPSVRKVANDGTPAGVLRRATQVHSALLDASIL